ncbi:hypothetical protein SAY87_019349 [Trapa incisa]|uniref:Uncharacterized protein n=1 Tax=Trapa incisa TaxID=236973 RepID=A0AAN7K5L3_9MYRT|nr:hypothetical protein SAY87_019349 [Trapa incisa]
MVKKRRLDNNGSTGFQVWSIPRAPRSARKKGLYKKTTDGRNFGAIELLASLAGKLLHENENSASRAASEGCNLLLIPKDMLQYKIDTVEKSIKSEDHGSSVGGAFALERASENSQQKDSSERSPKVEGNTTWDGTSVFTNFACCEKESSESKSTVSKSVNLSSEVSKSEKIMAVNEQAVDVSCLNDSTEEHISKPCSTNAISPGRKDDMRFYREDDDENISRFSKSRCTKSKPSKHSHIIIDRRIRKLLSFKHWKPAPQLKDVESFGSGRNISSNKRRINRHSLYYHDLLYKRKKLLDGSCFMNTDEVLSSEGHYRSHGVYVNQYDPAAFDAMDSQIKFSIKSFMIPELLIDVPETATVGSLKRTIVEAISTIIGRGFHVGVMLHGKKIHDDNRTLLQAGISRKGNLDNFGFMLEPNLTQSSPKSIAPQDSHILPCNISQQLTRTLDKVISDMGVSHSASDPGNSTSVSNNNVDNSHDLDVSLTQDIVTGKPSFKSGDLPILQTSLEPLAVVPANMNNKGSEQSQRRTRKPFSVLEVEALIQAVEELGTGRWRDVKLRSFENKDHRTYVDLKDKWRTLVHTASIAAQQRRGDPVPQQLLDRVMAAHSYWSQHHSKQVSPIDGAPIEITDDPVALPSIKV